ncbi:MAG: hypothetical protein PUA56_00580 [Bacillales bacterium]|nr:hypothetical protein [Bacillales bacterium]
MQERVLGAIIIGGIACVGVLWALIAGIPPLIQAKNQEKTLEQKLLKEVKAIDNEVTSIDIRRVTFKTVTEQEEDKWGDMKDVIKAVISLEGYNNKDENIKCDIKAENYYINDLQNKLSSNSLTAKEALNNNIYQNYSMTTAKLLNDILEETEYFKYFIGQGTYGALFSNEGTRIVSLGDPMKANGMFNNPFTVKDALSLEETTGVVYTYGRVKEVSKDEYKGNDYFNVVLEDINDATKTINVANMALSTGISSIEKENIIMVQAPINVTSSGNIIKENDTNGVCKIVNKDEIFTLKDNVKSVKDVEQDYSKLSYGQVTESKYYIYGKVTSITSEVANGKTIYNIALETEGKDDNHQFNVYNATIDRTNVISSEINVGDTIVCSGQLMSDMFYGEIK